MHVAAAIARAALPDGYTVCGIRLRPFSIGHWLHGQRFNLSFLDPEAESHGLGDLLLGCLICSDTYESFADSLANGDLARVTARWRYRLAGGLKGSLRRRLARMRGRIVAPDEFLGINLRDECDRFQCYINDHGAVAAITNDWSSPVSAPTKAGESVESATPGVMMLLDGLVSEAGLSRAEALNMPLPLARWTWAVHAERKGWSRIIDLDEARKTQAEADEIARKVFNAEHPE